MERVFFIRIEIDHARSGKVVWEILKGELAFSSSVITFLKNRDNGILVNGEHATVRKRLSFGDILTLNYDDSEKDQNETLLPVELPLEILYKDRDIIVVNKPPHMPTHPSHGHQNDTLANALAYYFKDLKKPFVFRAINRLDSETSGIVLVARNKVAAQHLSDDMVRGHIRKQYFTVLHGALSPAEGNIQAPIRRAENSKIKRIVAEDGAPSLTRYRTLAANEMYSAVMAAPISGRTHQLRVHFSHMGNCICGDTLYGYPCQYISRQALHAVFLEFPHPSSGETMRITAPLPEDIQQLCEHVFCINTLNALKKQTGLFKKENLYVDVEDGE